MDTAPIRHEYVLPVTPREAFDAYVEEIGQWWDPSYSPDAEGYRGLTIEPRVGGRVYHVDASRGEVVWGRVLAIAPGAVVVHTSTLGQDPAHPSRITAQFVPLDEGGTRFEFEHGGWTEDNAGDRAKFTDWPAILDRYASFVATTT
jgi:uncharacterized protein YndB with AHSA1/START domain